MLKMLELLMVKAEMVKIMLTCFKHNPVSNRFISRMTQPTFHTTYMPLYSFLFCEVVLINQHVRLLVGRLVGWFIISQEGYTFNSPIGSIGSLVIIINYSYIFIILLLSISMY